MAVTSAGSAEMVAVSSIFTYDIYRCMHLMHFVLSPALLHHSPADHHRQL